jgi:hypothetical protein
MFVFTSNLRATMKKRLIIILFFFISITAYGGNTTTPNYSLIDKDKLGGPTQQFVFFADFLYWHASEETSSSWAYIPQLPNITAPNVYFGWDPGVRTGLKFESNNLIDMQIYWSYFTTKSQESSTASPNQTLVPEFFNGFTTLTPFTSAKVNWQLTMNMIDLEVGHLFNPFDSLSVRPFIGIKGGTINQGINSTWSFQGELFNIFPIAYSATEQLKNNFYGIGPSFGIDGKWKLYKNFNIRSDFSGAWLWGNWSIQDIYSGPSLSGLLLATTISSNSNTSLGSLMLRYFTGIDWTYEAKESAVTLKVGYEMQYWMNQLRLPLFQQVPVHGDLTLQGGTCGILIKF